MNKILMVLAMLLSAVAIAANPVKTSPEMTVYTQDKTNIVVSVDSPEFTIKLESNPTTGYSWFLHEYNATLVQPVKREFIQGDKKLIGSPGYDLWTFKIKPAGFIVPQQTTIRFAYARPWEGSENSTQVAFHISTVGK